MHCCWFSRSSCRMPLSGCRTLHGFRRATPEVTGNRPRPPVLLVGRPGAPQDPTSSDARQDYKDWPLFPLGTHPTSRRAGEGLWRREAPAAHRCFPHKNPGKCGGEKHRLLTGAFLTGSPALRAHPYGGPTLRSQSKLPSAEGNGFESSGLAGLVSPYNGKPLPST